ncbi:MAG: tetratricopeptide repeat protein [Pseudomonadota bacterium]
MKIKNLLIALFFSFLLTACGESETAASYKKANNDSVSEVSHRLASASESAGDFPVAEKLYRQAFEKNSSPENIIELVDFYRRHNGTRQALVILTKAMKDDPKNTDIMRSLANVNIDSGAAEEAIKILNNALLINKTDALLYNSKGVALDLIGKHKEARENFNQAIELAPEDSALFKANLGMSYITTEYYTKAINLLKSVADSAESTPQIRQNLALAFGLKGDRENALKYGLKDLPTKQAEDNIKFYNLVADKSLTPKNSNQKSGTDTKFDKIENIPAIP